MAFILISSESSEILNKSKLTRQGALLCIQSGMYTQGHQLPRRELVLLAPLRLSVTAAVRGEKALDRSSQLCRYRDTTGSALQ